MDMVYAVKGYMGFPLNMQRLSFQVFMTVSPSCWDVISKRPGYFQNMAVRFGPGWLHYSQLNFIRGREKRQKQYEELYGLDNALFLMEQEGLWLSHYTNACFIRWQGLNDIEQFMQDAKIVANDANLPLRTHNGNSGFLKALLSGGLDERFLKIPPGMTADMDCNGNIVAVGV